MVAQPQVETIKTAEEFDEFILEADPEDKIFEFIGGEIVEVPSNPYVSGIGLTIGSYIRVFVRENGNFGHVTGADGGYRVSGERYAPDVGYISKDRQSELARIGYNLIPPELAVEVISNEANNQELNNLRWKITNYLAAGTVVWVVFPASMRIEIHAPGQAVKKLGIDDILDGGDILPGFKLPVRDILE